MNIKKIILWTEFSMDFCKQMFILQKFWLVDNDFKLN